MDGLRNGKKACEWNWFCGLGEPLSIFLERRGKEKIGIPPLDSPPPKIC